jgi:4,5-DOPA dioxygenase extradiol
LREDGILIMGSGSLTHNLAELRMSGRIAESAVPAWVSRFGDWAHERISAGVAQDLAHYRERAPFARQNHPTEEHFLPLPFAMGAAGEARAGVACTRAANMGR